MSEETIPIKELMEKTEKWLLGQGYKKSTLGFYRATWNRFLSYSASPAYSRETAEQFLLQYFGVDVHAIDQTLDGRMRHARRHMNALDEIFRTGTVCRRKVYGVASIDDDCFDKFSSGLHTCGIWGAVRLKFDRKKFGGEIKIVDLWVMQSNCVQIVVSVMVAVDFNRVPKCC